MRLLLLLPLLASTLCAQLVSGRFESGSFGGSGATSAPPSGAWSPSDSTWLRAWYEADDLDAALADGNNVTWWSNKCVSTGQPYNLTNWASRNPVFQAEEWNGHDAVQFAYSDGMSNTLVNVQQPFTALLCLRQTAVPADQLYMISGLNSSVAFFGVGAGYTRLYAGSALSIGAASTNWTVWTLTAEGGTGTIYSNNVNVASGSIGAGGFDGMSLGIAYTGGLLWGGYMGSVSLYGTNLPTETLSSMYGYATNLYPIQP